MTKAQELQLERKLRYFEEYIDSELAKAKYPKPTKVLKEMLIQAYLRGRGDKV